jgi:hypothetical protein
VPEGLIDGLVLYVVHGLVPGSFLLAVLDNDLMEAFSRADARSTVHMKNLVMFIYNDMPRGSWGSRAAVLEWHEHQGLVGLHAGHLAKKGGVG